MRPKDGELIAVPVTKLYDMGTTVAPAKLLAQRIGDPCVTLHPQTADRLGLGEGAIALVELENVSVELIVKLDASISTGVALIARSMGVKFSSPASVKISLAEKATA